MKQQPEQPSEPTPVEQIRAYLRSLQPLSADHAQRLRIAIDVCGSDKERAEETCKEASKQAKKRFASAITKAKSEHDAVVDAAQNRITHSNHLTKDTIAVLESALSGWVPRLRALSHDAKAADDPSKDAIEGLSKSVRAALSFATRRAVLLNLAHWLRRKKMLWLGFFVLRRGYSNETKALAAAVCQFEKSTESACQVAHAAIKSAKKKLSVAESRAESERDGAIREAERLRGVAQAEAEKRRVQSIDDAAAGWMTACRDVARKLSGAASAIQRRFPDWPQVLAHVGEGFDALPAAVPFGDITMNLAEAATTEDGQPSFADPDATVSTPALLSFTEHSSLLLEGDESCKESAMTCLQTLMLRLLTAFAPGKVRFTMIDPLGLGRSFAQFMHLADYDELLVTTSIWTETREIERELEKITDHMRMVIQKYLRGEYASISEYNAEAGEVAEPFRFLIISSFPAKFSATAIERLLSIASSGSSCGVYVLMNLDTTQELPRGLNLKELESAFTVVDWRDGQFHLRDDDFGKWPMTLPPSPPIALFTDLLRSVGEKARNANKVEVPFRTVTPPDMAIGKSSAKSGISVPIGRAGARRLQRLEFGVGTAQHALVAGKTGSGKSSLLHALITNTALHYSPDEVELFLVDFKKGVEFKPYAVCGLPHARVIAIESEREFGLSVLRRLDDELHSRGERFRKVGAQDLAAYRTADKSQRCPRILLIVDEFQEFFVEDDKVARESALLLDRLVRQGRAFGIHVVLGSQTLGGAYSLARATIDQMAVRIALQCSETDARLVLGDDNAAAHLLTRPGEAIYNDANGRTDGNTIFQVAWLPDHERENYLKMISAAQGSEARRFPTFVFEGSIPADIRCIPAVCNCTPPTVTKSPQELTLWLGEPAAIKEPTAAVLRRQAGCNLLMVGNNEEISTAMVCAILLSLSRHNVAQADSSKNSVRIVLFDGTPADSRHAGVISDCLGSLCGSVKILSRREAAAGLSELADEVRQRVEDAGGKEAGSIVLILNGIQSLRDLRRPEGFSAFGASKGSEGASAVADLTTILRDGPACGVHAVVWADTVGNATRAFDRQTLRDFELRLVMQMSTADSTSLIDSPAAAKLGPNRAFLYRDDLAFTEKFRPYGPTDASTMQSLCKSIKAAVNA
jgi:DNA segregation ATPase FtsK/SpoIIIE, S-DNA-T family